MPAKKHFWQTGLLNLIVQLVLLVLVYFLGNSINISIASPGSYLLITFITFIPSVLWALFFYFQDKKTPEPLPSLFASFGIGIAAAVIVFMPIVTYIFKLQDWLYGDMRYFLLGSLFIYAPLIVVLFYAVIRIVFYPMPDFDEPIDGMIYGSFMGAGFALAKAVVQIVGAGDVTVFYGVYTASVHTILYASLGAMIGYFIGISKFNKKRIEKNALYAITFGILIVSAYQFINEYIFMSGVEYAFELSFLLSIVYGLIILGWCYFEMHKLSLSDEFKHSKAKPGLERAAIGVLLITLVAGIMLTSVALRVRYFEDAGAGISFSYSPYFSKLGSFGTVPDTVTGALLFSADGNNVRILCMRADRSEPNAGEPSGTAIGLRSPEDITINGQPAKRYLYAYLSNNGDGLPELYWVYHDVVRSNDEIFVFMYSAQPAQFDLMLHYYEQLLKTVHFRTGEVK